MAHSIYWTGLSERIFILHNMCHASRSLCSQYRIGRFVEGVVEYDWDDYFGHLKVLVCESLIHLAIRIRIIEDSVISDEQDIEWAKIDKETQKGLTLAKYLKGQGKITIRELCNKIIHATDLTLNWASFKRNNTNSPGHWTGTTWLFGKKYKSEWKLEINVEALCVAFHRYINALEEEINWDSLYKYDI